MRMLSKCVFILSAVSLFFSLFSCQNEDVYYIDYVVTVVPEEEGSFYLVNDDRKTLKPAKEYSFKAKKKQRAIAVLTFEDEKSSSFDYIVNIHRLDTFLTKPIARNMENENLDIYGNDPVSIHSVWIGDGYLNILFGSWWGEKTHFVNVIQSNEENDPYELEFRHNSYNDFAKQYAYSIAAFDLSTLPDTRGKTVEIKLKVLLEETGEELYKLKYNSESTGDSTPKETQSIFQGNFKKVK